MSSWNTLRNHLPSVIIHVLYIIL